MQVVWVFTAPKAGFPSAVFSDRDRAEEWIMKHSLEGTLTAYPLDIGVFEWAVERGFFQPKPEKVIDSTFVGRFSSASQEHYHYEHGRRL